MRMCTWTISYRCCRWQYCTYKTQELVFGFSGLGFLPAWTSIHPVMVFDLWEEVGLHRKLRLVLQTSLSTTNVAFKFEAISKLMEHFGRLFSCEIIPDKVVEKILLLAAGNFLWYENPFKIGINSWTTFLFWNSSHYCIIIIIYNNCSFIIFYIFSSKI